MGRLITYSINQLALSHSRGAGFHIKSAAKQNPQKEACEALTGSLWRHLATVLGSRSRSPGSGPFLYMLAPVTK